MHAGSLIGRLTAWVLALSVFVAPSFAQAANPFAGIWELDRAQSVYEPIEAAPERRTMTLEGTADHIKSTTRTLRTAPNNGGFVTNEVTYSAAFDGKEYPTPATGATVQFRRIDARTLERVARLMEHVAETATWTLSGDGRTLTITSKGTDATGSPYRSTQVYTKTSSAD
jgi:hypothetical protein